MEEVVVMFPSPGIGHLISMVELGKFILAKNQSPLISIIILTTNPPFNTGATSDYIRRVSSASPPPSPPFAFTPFLPLPSHVIPIPIQTSRPSRLEITCLISHMKEVDIRRREGGYGPHHGPHLPPSSLCLTPSGWDSRSGLAFELLRLHDPNVHSALQSISLSSKISTFIIDLFCSTAYSIGINLKIPTFHFWTSCIGSLACFLFFHELHKTIPGRLRDWKQSVEIPGLPSCAATDLPSPILDRGSSTYETFLELCLQMRGSSGIRVNSFDSLEPDSLKALQAGLCIPDHPTPPIYCIGPLIASGGEKDNGLRHECLTWLDSQPTRSVVYLCFGSQGAFSAEQLKEIAVGLERSGQRFLWVVRSPPSKDSNDHFLPRPEPDLDTLLPDGFLARVSERGMVVRSWAPQVSVLGHESVGAFVTHCGWNSVLESVLLGGVPMVTWPLYAEQRHNKVILVEGLKLALAMNEEEEENGLVGAEKVERRVREIMESEEAKCIRERVRAAKECARAATAKDGTTLVAWTKFKQSLNSG